MPLPASPQEPPPAPPALALPGTFTSEPVELVEGAQLLGRIKPLEDDC